MNKPATKPSRLAAELVEMADGLRRVEAIDEIVHDNIKQRHCGSGQTIAPVSQDEVKAMRASARMSQAQFARHLNLSTDYISKLERGEKRPAGAALALLDIIRRKGIEAIIWTRHATGYPTSFLSFDTSATLPQIETQSS